MKVFKIHQNYYLDFQQAVDAAFEDSFIKTGKCEHIFPPEMEADEDGYIVLQVNDYLYNLPDMRQFLALLDEIKP
jgi:hypothetical protein